MLSKLTIRPHCAYGSVFTGKLRFARATPRLNRVQGEAPAGGWGGYSPIQNSPQQDWGIKGVDKHSRRPRQLIQTTDWIPASAGMTEGVQQDAAGVWGVPRSLFSFAPPRVGARGLITPRELL